MITVQLLLIGLLTGWVLAPFAHRGARRPAMPTLQKTLGVHTSPWLPQVRGARKN